MEIATITTCSLSISLSSSFCEREPA